ncbi:MAG: hypothetical protein D6797_01995 [Bdellovibrio sp.]|nr:MAG: hypothetical protein D6797_01995 [Bdellovibrio sp.]
MKDLKKETMLKALSALDQKLKAPIGRGGAMILAHQYPLSTLDIDAVLIKQDFSEIDPLVKEVGKELQIAPDWLNTWFSSFTHVLPPDFKSRLVEVFKGQYKIYFRKPLG